MYFRFGSYVEALRRLFKYDDLGVTLHYTRQSHLLLISATQQAGPDRNILGMDRQFRHEFVGHHPFSKRPSQAKPPANRSYVTPQREVLLDTQLGSNCGPTTIGR